MLMNDVLIAGRRMERSIADFVRACEVYIAEEQDNVGPDNTLIALLCDAIRLTREMEDLDKAAGGRSR
jgi:hypothetical protein